MVRWVVGSILHGVDPLNYFSFQPVLHDWRNKDRGMCYPVCGIVHINEPLLLIGKLNFFSFPSVFHEWHSKCGGMCNSGCRMEHIKDPLLLIVTFSTAVAAAGLLSRYLSGTFPYNLTPNKMC